MSYSAHTNGASHEGFRETDETFRAGIIASLILVPDEVSKLSGTHLAQVPGTREKAHSSYLISYYSSFVPDVPDEIGILHSKVSKWQFETFHPDLPSSASGTEQVSAGGFPNVHGLFSPLFVVPVDSPPSGTDSWVRL
jgi:hypothetical protein